jgi:hypothetical protein
MEIIGKTVGKRLIIAVNKTDLCDKEFNYNNCPVVYISAKEEKGFEKRFPYSHRGAQCVNIQEKQ